MEEFEPPNLIASFLHMEDNQDGTCTMTICMDGINIVTSVDAGQLGGVGGVAGVRTVLVPRLRF